MSARALGESRTRSPSSGAAKRPHPGRRAWSPGRPKARQPPGAPQLLRRFQQSSPAKLGPRKRGGIRATQDSLTLQPWRPERRYLADAPSARGQRS